MEIEVLKSKTGLGPRRVAITFDNYEERLAFGDRATDGLFYPTSLESLRYVNHMNTVCHVPDRRYSDVSAYPQTIIMRIGTLMTAASRAAHDYRSFGPDFPLHAADAVLMLAISKFFGDVGLSQAVALDRES